MAIKAESLIKIIIPVNFLFVIFIFTPIFAEVIVLNSGQTLNTKIKERTPKYIRVEVDNYGTVLKYPIEQIESIDGERLGGGKDSRSVIPREQNSDWYVNDDFSFSIKKIAGWGINHEERNVVKGVEILGLSFTRPGWERNVSGPLIILIRKFPETMSGAIVKTMQGDKFISYANNLISAVTKNADKNSFPINTLLINNLRVREARFEWIDQKGNYKTSILMFFEPVQVGYKYIEIQVMFSDNSRDYSAYRVELEKSLKNIKVMR